MRHKDKMRLVHLGGRVRVAAEGKDGAEAWQNARLGTVASQPNDKGAQIKLDGEQWAHFITWDRLDLVERPRPVGIEIPISQIRPSRWQYRRSFDGDRLLELAQSIEQHNLINAILVFDLGTGAGFELIAGERRVRAMAALALAEKLDTKLEEAVRLCAARDFWQEDRYLTLAERAGPEHHYTIRAEVYEGPAEQWQAIALVENLQRENPTAIEEAEGIQALMDQNGYTQREIAKVMGRSEGWISQRLGLLALAEPARQAVHSGEIPFSTARAVASLPDTIQPRISHEIAKRMASDEPATVRQVAALASQIKRFFDPDHWQPKEGQWMDAHQRNCYRLMAYHVDLARQSERAGDLATDLTDVNGVNYIGTTPAKMTSQPFMMAKTLNVLTGTDHDPYKGPGPWWAEYASHNGAECNTCRWPGIEPVDYHQAMCARWRGETAQTCINWIGPGDPVVLALTNAMERAANTLAGSGGESKRAGIYGEGWKRWTDDFDLYRELAALTVEYLGKQATAEQEAKERGHLGPMAAYWAAQPAGLGGLFVLEHGQAHHCRSCWHYRPELMDQELPPCSYAAEPLRNDFGNRNVKAPRYSVMVSSAGVMVPRCEVYQIRPENAKRIGKVEGISLQGEAAQRWIIDTLRAILAGRGPGLYSERHGAMAGILSWLPYERPNGDTSADRALDWISFEAGELGAGRLAYLVALAIGERAACETWQGPMVLLDPWSGKYSSWAVIPWSWFEDGTAGRDYPETWPKPWVKEGGSDGKEQEQEGL